MRLRGSPLSRPVIRIFGRARGVSCQLLVPQVLRPREPAIEQQTIAEVTLHLQVHRLVRVAGAVYIERNIRQVRERPRLIHVQPGSRRRLVDVERHQHLAPTRAYIGCAQAQLADFLLQREVPVLCIRGLISPLERAGDADARRESGCWKGQRPLHEPRVFDVGGGCVRGLGNHERRPESRGLLRNDLVENPIAAPHHECGPQRPPCHSHAGGEVVLVGLH